MIPRPWVLPDIATGVQKVDETLRRWKAVLDVALACPLLRGVLVAGTMPDVGAEVTLRHSLGRVPIGWFHVRSTDGDELNLVSSDEATITFEQGFGAGVDTPFTLWIF